MDGLLPSIRRRNLSGNCLRAVLPPIRKCMQPRSRMYFWTLQAKPSGTEPMKELQAFLAMVKASLKMFIRNKGTIVFSLLLPMVMLSVFGFLSGRSGPSIRIGLTNHATSQMAVEFERALVQVGAFSIETLTEAEASDALGKGHI